MLVRSLYLSDHVKNLGDAVAPLQKFKGKLNPEKNTFKVASSMFLQYLVTQKETEANPSQLSARLEMKSPTTIKEV